MTLYYKIVNGQTPAYLFEHVPKEAPRTLRKYVPKAPITRTKRYANSFFPYCINHWESLDSDIKSSTSVQTFKNKINERIRPDPSFCCNHNKHGMSRLTQIRIDFSDLRDHRFNHLFNCQSPICACGIGRQDLDPLFTMLLSLPQSSPNIPQQDIRNYKF